MDALIPVRNVATLDDLAARSVAVPRFNMLLLGVFAAIALLLPRRALQRDVVRVAQRTREIGVHDFQSFAVPPLLFLVVAWVGSYLPARRASRMDPVEALRARRLTARQRPLAIGERQLTSQGHDRIDAAWHARREPGWRPPPRRRASRDRSADPSKSSVSNCPVC